MPIILQFFLPYGMYMSMPILLFCYLLSLPYINHMGQEAVEATSDEAFTWA